MTVGPRSRKKRKKRKKRKRGNLGYLMKWDFIIKLHFFMCLSIFSKMALSATRVPYGTGPGRAVDPVRDGPGRSGPGLMTSRVWGGLRVGRMPGGTGDYKRSLQERMV